MDSIARKLLAFLMVAVLGVFGAACGDDGEDEEADVTETLTEEELTVEEETVTETLTEEDEETETEIVEEEETITDTETETEIVDPDEEEDE